MTREQIRNKYGITQLEHPSIVNKELSEEEAAGYEKIEKNPGLACKKCYQLWKNLKLK